MATPRQGHQGDPYARDPGEFQIPYSWVPEPDAPTGRHADGPGPGRSATPRRRRVRRGALVLVVVLGLGTSAAAALSREALPNDWLPAWGVGPFPDRTHTPHASTGTHTTTAAAGGGDTPSNTDTPSVTDTPSDTDTPSGTDTTPGTETDPGTGTGTATDSPSPFVTPSGTPVSWADLEVGDCVAGREARSTALRVDCDEAHHFELFATAPRYRADTYPGDTLAQAQARQQCAQRFTAFTAAYLGTDELSWTAGTVSRTSWSLGRPVVCYLMERSKRALYGSAVTDAPGFDTSD
ncbi:septum formation family protein [Streptomyces sp. AN091965]|uniref:septum formation family protein n=1 Tax=Streptomyces sp. AN091965 TaxID=2927803 RepID=UPI001F60B3A6|nr:septum formation family protein [Streptomyces sp. AN091965]MCI3935234.1 septum formation family protein [Streptomyces sp. AN091965]